MPDIVYPYNFTNGTLAQAPQVDANFAAVTAVVNGALTNSNLSSVAAIALSKLGLNPGSIAFNQSTTGQATWASGLTTDIQPRVQLMTDKGLQFGPGGSTAPDIELIRSAVNTLQILTPSGGPGIYDGNGGTLQNFATITLASGGVFNLNGGSISGTSFPMVNNGRLYLTSGNPYADTGASTTLFFGPTQGNQITLYNGTAEVTQTFMEASIGIGGLSSNTVYDVYVKSASSTSVILSTVAWSGINTPPTRGVQDGRLTKNGDATSLLVGAISMTGSSTCVDNTSTRGVSNLYNAVSRALFAQDSSTAAATATIAPVNANTTDGTGRVSFVCVLANQAIEVNYSQSIQLIGAYTGSFGLGFNSTTAYNTNAIFSGSGFSTAGSVSYATSAPAGYSYIQKLCQYTTTAISLIGGPSNSLGGYISN
jgi:hypothetical protein